MDSIDPIRALQDDVRRHDFVAAVRRLECVASDRPRVGDARRYHDDVVRLSQWVTLGFTGTSLQQFEPGAASKPGRLYCNFLGLFGSNGPLPLHLTEYAHQRALHHGDRTFREFLDLFNHRMLSLFYKAGTQFDPVIAFDRPDDNRYEDFVGALAGLVPRAARERECIDDHVRFDTLAWSARAVPTPDGIVGLVSAYFDLRCRVREFVGGWLTLPDPVRFRLGRAETGGGLGRSVYIGRRTWSIGHRFTVQLGPLDWRDYRSLQPGSARLAALHDLVHHYVGDEWDWDLELELAGGEVQPLVLDNSRALGFSAWLGGRRERRRAPRTAVLGRARMTVPSPNRGAPSDNRSGP